MKKKPEQKNENKVNYLIDNFVIDAINIIKDTAGEVSTFKARVQEADKVNLNRRIYLKDALKEAVDFYKKKIAAKQSYALVDHPDMCAGASFDKVGALITDIWFDENDNFVYIEGTFIKNDNFRTKLKPIIDAGGALPFSVRGYSVKDGNPEWSDEKQAWIFGKGYRIGAYDFVVDPALEEASTISMEQREEQQADINLNKSKEEHRMFKTVDELRAEYPSLVKILDDQIETLKKTNDANEKTVIETKKQVETLTAEVSTKTDSLNKANAEIAKAKFDMGVTELMKDHKYAKFINIPATVTTIEDATAYITAETAKLDAFKASMAPAAAPVVPVVTPAVTPAPTTDALTPITDPAVVNMDSVVFDTKEVDEFDRLARS